MSDQAVRKRDKASASITNCLKFAKHCEHETIESITNCLTRLKQCYEEFNVAHENVLEFTGEDQRSFQESVRTPVDEAYKEAQDLLAQIIIFKRQVNVETDQQFRKKFEDLARLQRFNGQQIHKCIERINQTQDPLFIRGRLEMLKGYWDQYQHSNIQILENSTQRDFSQHDYFTTNEYDLTQETYFQALMKFTNVVQLGQDDTQSGSSSPRVQQPAERIHHPLPRIELPTFNGTYTDWIPFRDMFTSIIIDNKSICNVQRLHYLKSSLTDEAAQLVKNIAITDGNFQIAWTTLTSQYENTKMIINSHLRSLTNLAAMKASHSAELKNLVNGTNESIRALAHLNRPTGHWDDWLVFITVQKLDKVTREQWESSTSQSIIPTFNELITFLQNRIRTLDYIESVDRPHVSSKQSSRKYNPVGSNTQTYVATESKCAVCQQKIHPLYQCDSFKESNTKDRRNILQQNGYCYNCLSPGHQVRQCSNKGRCRTCNRKHHTLVHEEQNETLSTPEPVSDSPTSVGSQSTTTASFVAQRENRPRQVLLSTALVRLKSPTGLTMVVRALLDSGSESTFISEAIAQSLQLVKSKVNISITGLGQTSAGTSTGSVKVTLESMDNVFSRQLEALTMKKITCQIPQQKVAQADWAHIQGIKLADPRFYEPSTVDMLIGADVYGELLDNGLIHGPPGTPVIQKTKVGWVLHGVISKPQPDNASKSIVSLHSNLNLEKLLKTFWEIEEVPTTRIMTNEEQECEKHYNDTHSRSNDGRYIVQLPFRQGSETLGNSRDAAVSQMYQVERRLAKNSDLKHQYIQFMQEYETMGHMTKTSPHHNEISSYYMPHHAVLKEDSTTTKLRVVFDASRLSKSGVSLNNKLMVGPKLQNDLYDTILRFRKHQFALSADIAKMYRQIRVTEDDQQFQRIVWRESPNLPLQDYKLSTVTYGTSAAPYLAVKTLFQLALDEQETFPMASKVLREDFYVDDLLTGCENKSEAILLHQQMVKLLATGGFEIRKWSSNNLHILNTIPEQLRESQQIRTTLKFDESIKTLGLLWCPNLDQFHFQVGLNETTKHPTKRIVLSEIAKLFDPIGFLAPCIISGKILMQRLWLMGLNWDTPLPPEMTSEWAKFKDELKYINSIRIPRWIQTTSQGDIEMHGFADASEKAYAAVIYVRTIDSNNKFNTHLITSKTRVAPTRQISLPRLELCAAVLTAKLMNAVKQTLKITCQTEFLWSDSTITLAWIKSQPSKWKTFIANRVSEIHTYTDPSWWNHISSADNPADCASRGLSPSNLASFALWWNGPIWLNHDQEEWPTSKKEFCTKVEEKTHKVSLTMMAKVDNSLLHKYSSLGKLKRITAYCLRFIHNTRVRHGQRRTGHLNTEELESALVVWVKRSQSEEYGNEISQCLNGNDVPTKSKIRSLSPFVDSAGILRVGGRLRNSNLPHQQKHQIILPPNNVLTQLVLSEIHLKNLHAGAQLMICSLRQKFWVVSARSTIRKIIHCCTVCFKFRASSNKQLMGNLPAHRITPNRPFLKCGVDYAGPIILRMSRGRGPPKTFKAYVAVFVCLSTRAMHLEVISDMTSEAFLSAYRRFISRRGHCADMYSDNGTTFVGAEKELGELLQNVNYTKTIKQELLNHQTNWHFIPPGAPHFGGLWEAGVKSVKHHLRRAIGSSMLTYEEIQTLLCQIEACLNSRPLCPQSDDLNDMEAITPGHFLISEPLTAISEPNLLDEKIPRLSRFQYLQYLQQHFWKRWSSEYLAHLQQRPKWTTTEANITKNELVIIKDENLPPTKWKLGRVIDIHPGSDGLVRVVTLKCQNGTFKRPITKVCVFPRHTDNNV